MADFKGTFIDEEGRVRLSEDFVMRRYGVDCRMAREEDSEFILSLRTDERLSRYIHSTDADLDKQREWMRLYKQREAAGSDYYFLYSYEGVPFGLSRIYDIERDRATGGSWVCRRGTEVQQSMATTLIARDILFEILGFELDHFDVRKGNKQVQKMHHMFGAEVVGETELDLLYVLTKENYERNKVKVIKLLGL